MKRFLVASIVLSALGIGWVQTHESDWGALTSVAPRDKISVAFREGRSGIQVAGEGIVSRLLPDDNKGSRHQRFTDARVHRLHQIPATFVGNAQLTTSGMTYRIVPRGEA